MCSCRDGRPRSGAGARVSPAFSRGPRAGASARSCWQWVGRGGRAAFDLRAHGELWRGVWPFGLGVEECRAQELAPLSASRFRGLRTTLEPRSGTMEHASLAARVDFCGVHRIWRAFGLQPHAGLLSVGIPLLRFAVWALGRRALGSVGEPRPSSAVSPAAAPVAPALEPDYYRTYHLLLPLWSRVCACLLGRSASVFLVFVWSFSLARPFAVGTRFFLLSLFFFYLFFLICLFLFSSSLLSLSSLLLLFSFLLFFFFFFFSLSLFFKIAAARR